MDYVSIRTDNIAGSSIGRSCGDEKYCKGVAGLSIDRPSADGKRPTFSARSISMIISYLDSNYTGNFLTFSGVSKCSTNFVKAFIYKVLTKTVFHVFHILKWNTC